MVNANQQLKNEVRKAGLYLWQVADRLGIQDCNLSRKLRKELSEQEKAKFIAIIKELKEEGGDK